MLAQQPGSCALNDSCRIYNQRVDICRSLATTLTDLNQGIISTQADIDITLQHRSTPGYIDHDELDCIRAVMPTHRNCLSISRLERFWITMAILVTLSNVRSLKLVRTTTVIGNDKQAYCSEVFTGVIVIKPLLQTILSTVAERKTSAGAVLDLSSQCP